MQRGGEGWTTALIQRDVQLDLRGLDVAPGCTLLSHSLEKTTEVAFCPAGQILPTMVAKLEGPPPLPDQDLSAEIYTGGPLLTLAVISPTCRGLLLIERSRGALRAPRVPREVTVTPRLCPSMWWCRYGPTLFTSVRCSRSAWFPSRLGCQILVGWPRTLQFCYHGG